MKNDNKRRKLIEEIQKLSTEFLCFPNQCAYTDDIVRLIIEKTKDLEKL